jgi:Zn ribbon nucleic-acid-binding protein
MKGKMLHEGEWVKVRNMMNKNFRAGAPCIVCRAASCGMVWYSILSTETRCMKCGIPKTPNVGVNSRP